jgi:hypothetical protein
MKFKEFNSSNSTMLAPGEATIRINSKAGILSFSKEASRILQFNSTTKVVMLQDEDLPSDWYVKITEAENGFPLRKKDEKTEYCFNSTPLCKAVLASLKTDKTTPVYKAAGFKISKQSVEFEGETYWPIITIHPLTPRV